LFKSSFIAINKPVGIGSTDVVNAFKRVVYPTKIGHMGTLDPDASGVLIIAFHKAPRLFDHLAKQTKTYEFVVKFGVETDSLDHTGIVTKTSDVIPTNKVIEETIKSMVGESMQTPPMFSAVKINGKRAYDIAYENRNVGVAPKSDPQIKPKSITISSFKLLKQVDETQFRFEAEVSTGTYVRCIARDMAEKLGTVAHTTEILRTKVGKFSNIKAMIDFEKFRKTKDEEKLSFIEENIISPIRAFDYSTITLNDEDISRLLQGKLYDYETEKGRHYFIKSKTNEVVMLALAPEENKLKIEINLR